MKKIGIFRWIAKKKKTNKMQDELKMGKRLCILFLSVQVWKNISAATELCQYERLAMRKRINMSANEQMILSTDFDIRQIQKQSYLWVLQNMLLYENYTLWKSVS